MAREIKRLTDRGLAALREPGLHADGAGLYRRIDQTMNRRWVYIFHLAGRRREMGLGSAATVKLREARQMAEDARQALRRGEDPIAARRAAETPPTTTRMVLQELLTDLRPSWKNGKHQTQWETMLENHCGAILSMPVAEVHTEHVLRALRPIWTAKAVTGRKIRGRLERVFDAAKAKGLRSGENPARWRGHLDALLPRGKPPPRHHAAMPYDDLPAFMRELEARDGASARALRWTILTAARTTETTDAGPHEILNRATWELSAERMKATRGHRVPMTTAMLGCLVEGWESMPFLFEGVTSEGKLSSAAMYELLKGMRPGLTVHGFRSTFSDWVADCTEFSRETREAALAHQVGDEVEQAYRRGDGLAKRRRLMEAWSDFCLGVDSGKVLAFPDARAPGTS